MATISEIVERSELVQIRVQLDTPDRERRTVYAAPVVINWINNSLPNQTQFYESDATPREQMRILLKTFISGEALQEGDEFRLMQPCGDDVYELKSPDIRIFGWFYENGVFIATSIDTMERVHSVTGLSSAYQREVVRFRAVIDLDQPKYQVGASVSDVFSV